MVIILLKSIGNLQTKYNQDWALVLESSKVICIQCRRKTAVFNFKEANYTNHQSSLVCNEPLTIQLFVIEFDQNEGKFVVIPSSPEFNRLHTFHMKSSHSMSRWTINIISEPCVAFQWKFSMNLAYLSMLDDLHFHWFLAVAVAWVHWPDLWWRKRPLWHC